MQDKKKFYEARWFLWLFLILFPPIGIILIWTVHKDMKKKKKIILSVIFAIWFIILVVAMNKDNSTTDNKVDKQQETSVKEQTKNVTSVETTSDIVTEKQKDTKEEKSVSVVETSNDKFTNDEIEKGIKEAVKDDIDTKNESIKGVVLKNKDLIVYVDFSNADPSPLTIEDLAWSRTSSITDDILEHTEYFEYWNTVTVDFGDIGKVIYSQDDVETNEFGGRYFPEEKYHLQ